MATQCVFLKVGGFNRAERVCKLNRLVEIEAYLEKKDALILDESNETNWWRNVEIEVPEDHVETVRAYKKSVEEAAARAAHRKTKN